MIRERRRDKKMKKEVGEKGRMTQRKKRDKKEEK